MLRSVASRSAARVLRPLLHRCGGLRIAALRRRHVIVTFHEVGPNEARLFARVLAQLARHFEVVGMDTMLRRVRGEEAFGRACVALTFDDGLRNHGEVVYPLLKEMGLPATFYVCPGLIGKGMIWTWDLACRLPLMSESRRRAIHARAGLGPEASSAALVDRLKTFPIALREALEAEIRDATPRFRPTESQSQLYGLLDWEEIAALDPGVVTIGSHTMTHPDLPQVDTSRLEHELVESRRLLELRFGRPVRHLCYPNGHFDGRVATYASRSYVSAVSTACGALSPGDDPWTLKRVELGTDPAWASWMLSVRAS